MYFKILGTKNHAVNGGDFKYNLYKFTPPVEPRVCWRGYHLATEYGLFIWLDRDSPRKLYIAEPSSKLKNDRSSNSADKIAFRSVRLTEYVGLYTSTKREKVRSYLKKKFKIRTPLFTKGTTVDIWRTMSNSQRQQALPVVLDIIRGYI